METNQSLQEIIDEIEAQPQALTHEELEFDIIDNLWYLFRKLNLESSATRYWKACALDVWFRKGPEAVLEYWKVINGE